MTKGTRAIGIGLAIAIATAGANAANTAHAESRPFGASFEGRATPLMPTSDPCVLTITEAGKGRAVHMGVIAWASSESLNVCSNPAGIDVQGEFVMTAANGDQVSGRYTTVAHPDFGAGVFFFAGHWEIVGGTGRFEHATGEGTLSGEGIIAPPYTLTASFVGNISY